MIDVEKIENFILEKKYSRTGFAKKCKISYGVLMKILKDNDNFYILALFKKQG